MFKQDLFSINFNFSFGDSIYDNPCQNWLGSGYYPIMMNWNTSTDCCNWNGVTCDYFTGDVIGLDLRCGMLRGTINPNTTLFHLPHLHRLNLAFNNFNDSHLPHEIGKLANSLTHLNISHCYFTGHIPSEITLLSKLVSLDLSGNWKDFRLETHLFNNILQNMTLLKELSLRGVNISSVLPTYLNISSSLKLLNLRYTGLQGKLPNNIFNFPYLEKLDLSMNWNIIGPLPKVNMSISIPLKWLDLSATMLSGEIPHSIGYLKSLNILDLSDTLLSGEIPHSIGHLKSLNTLRLNDCGFMGPIPKFLVSLRLLTTLYLSSNSLNGTLPSWLFTLPSLQSILLSGNMFSGNIPPELFTCRSLKELSFGGNQLVGKIDVVDQVSMPQSFRKLSNLTYLDLSFNNFTGQWELNTLLSSLTKLEELDLSYSGFSVVTNNATHYVSPNFWMLRLASCNLTVFPESIRAMRKLQHLNLSNNKIHGHIPNWVGEIEGNQLYYLNLSHNFITGMPHFQWDRLQELYLQSNLIQGQFPPSICNLSDLLVLDMSNNSFGGVIPQCLGNITSSLVMVDLGNNRLHGVIPNLYEDCGQLQWLILNGNQLEGYVPNSLSKCLSLKVLDMGNNHLNGTFSGWLGDLLELQVLVLKSNNFHGSIETSSTMELPFPSLRILDLSHNGLVGHLPGKYFKIFNAMKNVVKNGTKPEYLKIRGVYYSNIVVMKGVEQLFSKILVDYTIVDLSRNRFEGEIPEVIGSLKSLKVLNLSHNSLTGQIPDALGNLSDIESLDISWNQLKGEIPQSLADITTLEVLNLLQNHLVGRIPEGKQFSTFDTSFGGNLGLCGFPLPKHCEHPKSPQLSDDGDTDSIFTWKSVILGYGCGTLLGLVMGYLILSTRRPKWFNAITDVAEHMIQMRPNRRRHV